MARRVTIDAGFEFHLLRSVNDEQFGRIVGKIADAADGRTAADNRNLLDRGEWRRAGFNHPGIGR